MLPSSYAGPTPSVQLASLPPQAGPTLARARSSGATDARTEEPAENRLGGAEQPRGEVDRLIAKYAALYDVPEGLVRRVVKRESSFNPAPTTTATGA